MGICPFFSASIFLTSTSTQMTSLPKSARPAPVTNPTYPVPMTEMFKPVASEPPGLQASQETETRHPESAERDEGSQNANRPAIWRSFAVFAAQDDAARETITACAVQPSRRPGGWKARRLITADSCSSSRSYPSYLSYSSYRP